MASISLCMIVRDEEAVLGRCLESVAPAVDEIIVVDTGSMDGTKAVAAAYTDRIFDFAWAIRTRSMTFRGWTIFPPPGTTPSPWHGWTTVSGWTQTMCCYRRIWMRCCV